MKTLREFYQAYADWVDAGAPDGNPFRREWGLCTNLYFFGYCDDDLLYEMSKQFEAAGLDPELPFNKDWDDYAREYKEDGSHLNAVRIQWVKDHLK